VRGKDFEEVVRRLAPLGGSLYLVWKGLTGRLAKAPGGWGAIMAPKLSRWMLGEDDAARMAARDDRDQRK
jgi:hypothetical protein